MDIEAIVPGHGKVCEVDYVREFSVFPETNIEDMNRLIWHGLTEEEVVQELEFDVLPAIHPDSEFHRTNIERLYEELFYA